MATITLTNPVYYINGSDTYQGNPVSGVVGYDGGDYRVVRYEFTSSETGAGHVSFSLAPMTLMSASAMVELYFYIGTSDTSHADGRPDSEYTGTTTTSKYGTASNTFTIAGEASVALQPNTKYYLWLFPSTTTYYRYYNATTVTSKTIETIGRPGIYLTNPIYYIYGSDKYQGNTVSSVIGYDGYAPRVVRYEFTSPESGAGHISFDLSYLELMAGSTMTEMRFYIGTSDTSHMDAGPESEYTGTTVTTKHESKTTYFTLFGEADIALLPNTKYYLWVFPSTTTVTRYYNGTTAKSKTINPTGYPGLVYIDNGSGWDTYQIYVDNGTGWDLHIPYIDNGSGWDLCT